MKLSESINSPEMYLDISKVEDTPKSNLKELKELLNKHINIGVNKLYLNKIKIIK